MSEPDPESFEAVVAAVAERIAPDRAEREALEAAVESLRARTRAAVADLPVEADCRHVGSTARGTWISGDRDIDFFVRFPTDLDREALERYGLAVGHEVLPAGREEYAEHPYVTGEFDGFTVDLVPCYAVEDAAEIRSAVDRTPFHTAYLEERLTDAHRSEARVLKRFLKGIGAYGSDLETRGFSGYLTELLVLEYGSFRGVLEAAAGWHPPVELDPEDHGEASFDDPLVVIDPTDPERNVAAVVSAANLARLQHHARAMLDAPDEAVFEPADPAPLAAEDVRAHLERRGTTPVAVAFEAPDVVPDQLYPQLRRSRAGIERMLEDRGFEVLRSAAFADDRYGAEGPGGGEDGPARAALLFELATGTLPRVERHVGPPVHVREHAEGFYRKYADDPDVYGPFLDGDRYVVERERAERDAAALLRSDALFEAALGARIEDALEADYAVRAGPDVAGLADRFGTALRRYFEPDV